MVNVQDAAVERGDMHLAVLMNRGGCKERRNYGRLGVETKKLRTVG